MHLLFLLEIASGGRVGAYFVHGVKYRVCYCCFRACNSLLTLLIKDIEIVQYRRPDGEGYGYYWKWNSRHVKNNRNPTNWW